MAQKQDYAEQLTAFLEEDTITVDERQELDQLFDNDLTYEQADAIETQVRNDLNLPPRNWKQEYQDSCTLLVDTYKKRIPKEELEKLQTTYVDSRRVSQSEAEALANQVGLKKRGSKAWLWLLLIIVIAASVAFFWFPQQSVEVNKVPQEILQMQTTQEATLPNQGTTIQEVGISKVAIYLEEVGYFNGNFKQTTLDEVQQALKLFQADLNVPQTGQLDQVVWDKLQTVRLSHQRQEALKTIQSK